MLERRYSRMLLGVLRWTMLLSGALPWVLMLAIPNVFISVMEWKFGFTLLFGLYVSFGLLWAAMEKESATKYSIEAPKKAIFRAFMLLLILTLVPSMVKIGNGVADDVQRQIASQIVKGRAQPGFVSVILIWPTLWALMCAYALKPLWDVAVDSLRTSLIVPYFNLGPYVKRVRKRNSVEDASQAVAPECEQSSTEVSLASSTERDTEPRHPVHSPMGPLASAGSPHHVK